jgi:hypothetical protein
VFARYYVELPLPAERAERVLADGSVAWLPGLAEEANRRGDALLAEVGFGEDVRIARRVAVELGSPIRMPTKTVVPLQWRAAGGPGLFPSLDADLEIAPLGLNATQLAVSARYVPPLGRLGRAIDRAVLHRVAEATIKDFLDHVREAVIREAAST